MTAVKDLFQADTIELHDLRADPNTVIKVQYLVKEMLAANQNRQMGLHQTIVEEYGLSALPGIISATYVLGDQLGSKARQEVVVQLLSELCEGSVAARRLLMRSGVVENPFNVSRKIAVDALDQIEGLQIDAEEAEWILEKTRELVRDHEVDAARIIYELLLSYGIGYEDALETCKTWFAGPFEAEAPSRLLSSLLRTNDNEIERTLIETFSALDRKDDEAGREIEQYVDLPSSQSVILAIRACSQLLERERVGRAKAVEFLFEGAIARQVSQTPETIQTVLEDMAHNPPDKAIMRYWWQALGNAVKEGSKEAARYFAQPRSALDEDESVKWAYVQLMFLRKVMKTRAWAEKVLEDLAGQDPSAYLEAEETYERMTQGGGGGGPARRKTGHTTIS